jgi:hypothetical protein
LNFLPLPQGQGSFRPTPLYRFTMGVFTMDVPATEPR